ncbi:synaptonemal complex protein 2-like [Erpetoichthys calabaricus]|uniref:synaptonemal complex protein 2-like n=1 Tax=Erpetoichthys calabaricus TaxID=27687 RepID=UPI0022343B3F|nr:synaptonemal complex protein 2-like [Erpetoichthys calabaricus]
MWFERAVDFLKSEELKTNVALPQLIEVFYDFALELCKADNEGKVQIQDLFILRLGLLVIDVNIPFALRLEGIRTINCILDLSSKEERKKINLTEELTLLLSDFARLILRAGDYEMQVAIAEALCRMTLKKWREELVYRWFENRDFADSFKSINDREFETDCRKFLNKVNSSFGKESRVWTFPCIKAFLDHIELHMPQDEHLEKFWIDFNLGSSSISFFINDPEGSLWDSVSLANESVGGFYVQEIHEQNILTILMEVPISSNKKNGEVVKIFFEPQFDILTATKLVFGPQKEMKSLPNIAEKLKIPEIVEIKDGQEPKSPSAKEARAQEVDSACEHSSEAQEKKYEPTPSERLMQASIKEREPQKPWYYKSAFLESDTSVAQSEKSSDAEFKHKTPLKLVEYSRKKPKAKPKVKAASPYSSADEQASLKTQHSTPKLPESLKDKESGPSTELSFQAENPPTISALLTPVSGPLLDESKFEEISPIKESLPANYYSDDFKKRKSTAAATKDQKRFKDDASEHPAEQQMTSHLQPTKLFSSSETGNVAEDEYVSDAVLYEDSDSGTEGGTSIIAAFENFNQELRKKFWARHRRMELQTQRALKVSKHTISDMLSHLHQCRLQRLSKFHSIVIHELSSLEKDAQSLMQMEADTMNFWKTQSQKLSSFCEIQEKKLKSLSYISEGPFEEEDPKADENKFLDFDDVKTITIP